MHSTCRKRIDLNSLIFRKRDFTFCKSHFFGRGVNNVFTGCSVSSLPNLALQTTCKI